MGNEDIMRFMQMFMSGNSSESSENSETSGNSDEPPPDSDSESGSDNSGGFNFEDLFSNINIDMLMKIGDLISRMNKTDCNSELLLALKPHLRDENQHKIDNAVRMSKMFSLLPYLKESGILNNIF